MTMTWENFTREEFACQCGCGTNEIKDSIIDVLQWIRVIYGKSMRITSGYRCANHPIERVKSRPGTHNLGLAADVGVSHAEGFRLLRVAMGHPGITGVGVNQKGSGRFIHLDIVEGNEHISRPSIWSY